MLGCQATAPPGRQYQYVEMSSTVQSYFCDKWRRGSYRRIALTLIELHADRHQNSCWLHSDRRLGISINMKNPSVFWSAPAMGQVRSKPTALCLLAA
eukprot:COSAG01_NODE_1429_length_10330_cov_4.369759_6_plen_97_part_00